MSNDEIGIYIILSTSLFKKNFVCLFKQHTIGYMPVLLRLKWCNGKTPNIFTLNGFSLISSKHSLSAVDNSRINFLFFLCFFFVPIIF